MSMGVDDAEVELRVDISFGSGEAIPFQGFSIILRNPLTFEVHEAEVDLRVGIPLGSGETIPLQGLGIILRDFVSMGEHEAEGGLRLGVPLGSESLLRINESPGRLPIKGHPMQTRTGKQRRIVLSSYRPHKSDACKTSNHFSALAAPTVAVETSGTRPPV